MEKTCVVHRWLSSTQKEKVIEGKEEMTDLATVEMVFQELVDEVDDRLSAMNVAREVTLPEIVEIDDMDEEEIVVETEVDQEIVEETAAVTEVEMIAVAEDEIEAEIGPETSLEKDLKIEGKIVD